VLGANSHLGIEAGRIEPHRSHGLAVVHGVLARGEQGLAAEDIGHHPWHRRRLFAGANGGSGARGHGDGEQ